MILVWFTRAPKPYRKAFITIVRTLTLVTLPDKPGPQTILCHFFFWGGGGNTEEEEKNRSFCDLWTWKGISQRDEEEKASCVYDLWFVYSAHCSIWTKFIVLLFCICSLRRIYTYRRIQTREGQLTPTGTLSQTIAKTYAAVTLSRKSRFRTRRSYVRQFSRYGVGRGYLVAVTGSTWLLRGLLWLLRVLCGCYGVYTPPLFAKIALRGSYGYS